MIHLNANPYLFKFYYLFRSNFDSQKHEIRTFTSHQCTVGFSNTGGL